MKQTPMCSAEDCQIDVPYLIRTIDDGESLLAFCPNHEIMWVVHRQEQKPFPIVTYPSVIDAKAFACEICEKTNEFELTAKNKIILYTLDNREEALYLPLCEQHLDRLILLKLTEQDYFILKNKHGIFYEIHEDFYDEEGNALQPTLR